MTEIYDNRYEKMRYLGKGATGEVILARDQKTGIQCALKILHAPLGKIKRIQLEGLRTEFQILKNLNHPSIAKVYYAGLNKGDKRFYLATEYIAGKDLFEATEGKSFEEIEDLLVQALRALNYLHGQHVFHLDIKPRNLLVTQNEEKELTIKIIDFGFANFYEQGFSKTNTNEPRLIVGTPACIPPEIIKREPHDGRADLYSLGCSFYKAFTRQFPFQGNQAEVYHKHLQEIPKLPSQINSLLPPYIDQIILKLLEKDPAKRYLEAKDVIKDLNISGKKSYDIETDETITSYLPQKGDLIGREKEFEKFKSYFNDRLYLKELKKKPYLIIKSKEGCGKTRFLQECKNEAHRYFIHVMTFQEASSCQIDQMPSPCLVIGDDITIQKYYIDYNEICYKNLHVLTILTTIQESIPCDPECIIELNNFDQLQTREYLVKATGLQISDKTLETVYKNTQGNPLYLTECVKKLFEKGYLKDKHGSWTPKMLEDFEYEIENFEATDIKKRLLQKLEALQLKTSQIQFLNMMALAGQPLLKPTLKDITEISSKCDIHELEQNLQFLVEKEILEVDVENNYSFINPLYREVLIEKMDPRDKADFCDYIADYYEGLKADQNIILYYRGRGWRKEASQLLLKLAKIKREQVLYKDAKENLYELLNKKDLDADTRCEALLELGEICIEQGNFEEAERHLFLIVHRYEEKGKLINLTVTIKAMEQLGLSYYKRVNPELALSYYQKGLDLVKNSSALKWLEVVLKNRLAQNQINTGQMKQAENLLRETWNIWKNQLNDEEKILAIRSDIDILYYQKRDYKKAIEYLEEILKILAKKPYQDIYPIKLYLLGRTYLQTHDFDKAEKYLKESLDLFKERKILQWLYAVYNELGNFYFIHKTDVEKALENYKHAFDLARKTTSGIQVFAIAFNIAVVNSRMNLFEEAKKYYEYVVKNIQNSSMNDSFISQYHLYKAELGLTEICRRQNKLMDAKKYLESAQNILNQYPDLKPHQQFYWQLKADLEKNAKNEPEMQKALTHLEGLKNGKGFNLQEYEKWHKSFLETKKCFQT